MAQAQQTSPAHLDADLRRSITAVVIALAMTALLIAALAFVTRPATPGPASVSSGAATDGWLSYLGAASSEPPAARDGWASYLLVDDAPAVDGWMSYLGARAATAEVVDGWMSRYGGVDD